MVWFIVGAPNFSCVIPEFGMFRFPGLGCKSCNFGQKTQVATCQYKLFTPTICQEAYEVQRAIL